MKLVVGLGNPGREYVGTRHNIGFEVVDHLARKLGWTSDADEFNRMARTRFDGLVLQGSVTLAGGGSEKVLLLKPGTYMNLSGQAVRAAMDFYQLEPVDVLIVLDDLALPCGRLRIRPGGSSGGHNGLRDIERVLKTTAYPRLRFGIDAPPPQVPGKAYVLGKWSPEQQAILQTALPRACEAVVTWIREGIETAMNRFNAASEG